MRLSGGAAARKEAAATASALKGVGTAAKGAGASSAVAAGPRGIQRFQKSMANLKTTGTKMKAVGSSMSRLVLPMALVGGAAIKMSVDFEREMRNVNSIAQLPEPAFKSLSNSVLNIASETAQAPRTLAEGMYTLVSSGFKAKESLNVVKHAARAATAGLTNTATSTKAVAAVINAYRLSSDQARAVSDTLFRTVDRGVISFEELAQHIGVLLPWSSGLGISLREVGASIATMTKAGIPAAETITFTKNVMAALIKPSTDLQKQMREIGFSSGSAMVRAKGFQGTLDTLAKASGGTKEAMGKLFPNIRGLSGVLALTGRNSKAAGEDLKGMMGDAGATAHALAQQTKATSFQWQRLKVDATVLAIKVGDVLLPVLIGLTGVIGTVVSGFSKLPGPVKTGVLVFVLLLAVIGPVISGIGSLIIAVSALGTALAFLWANPIGLVILGLILAGVAFVVLYKKVKWFRDMVDTIAASFKSGTWAMLPLIFISPILLVVLAVKKHFTRVKNFIVGIVKSVFGWLKDNWPFLPLLFIAPILAVVLFVRKNFGKIKTFIVGSLKSVLGFISSNWPIIRRILLGPVVNVVLLVIKNFDKLVAFIKSLPAKAASAMKLLASVIVNAIKGLPGKIAGLSLDIGKSIIEGIKSGLGFGGEEVLGEVTMTPRFRSQARGLGPLPKSAGPRRGLMGRAGSSRAPLTRPRIQMPSAGASSLTFERSPTIYLSATIRNQLDGREISRNTTKHVLDAEARS